MPATRSKAGTAPAAKPASSMPATRSKSIKAPEAKPASSIPAKRSKAEQDPQAKPASTIPAKQSKSEKAPEAKPASSIPAKRSKSEKAPEAKPASTVPAKRSKSEKAPEAKPASSMPAKRSKSEKSPAAKPASSMPAKRSKSEKAPEAKPASSMPAKRSKAEKAPEAKPASSMPAKRSKSEKAPAAKPASSIPEKASKAEKPPAATPASTVPASSMPAKLSKSGKPPTANPASSVSRKNVSDGRSKKEEIRKKRQGESQKNVKEEVSDEETSSSPSENEKSDHALTSSDSDEDNVTPPSKLGKKKKIEQDDDSSESDDDSASEEESEEDGEERKGSFFTDENAAWLKPRQKKVAKKSQLMSSSDEEEDDDNDEFQHDDEDEEILDVEKQSRLLDAEMEVEREEAEEEMRRTIAMNTSVFHLPSAEELEQDENRVVPPSEIRSRIESILEVLADFKARREPGRSRTEYVDQLASDIAELHGYLPELIEYFLSMFGPSETVEFVDASDRPRPLVIRTNTLKTRRKDLASALMKRGVTLDPLAPWSKVGLKITESPVPVGATPEYLTGMYMLQSAASMCPVMALSPQPSERVLDMSAAPGGKTSYLSQLMRNTGVIIANDLKADRQKATVANMHRLGVRNVITCTHDGRKMGDKFRNNFDRILLDAPCSGLGVISRDPSVKVQRTMADVNKCGHLQKELLLSAIDALNHKSKTGGVMVYSTCSVSVAENEEVINYALSKRDIKLIDTGLDFGKPGFTRYQQKRFHPSVALTRRFYPHVHNMDGFFVAKIQKLSDKRPGDTEEKAEQVSDKKPVESNVANKNDDIDEEPKLRRNLKKGGKKRKAGDDRNPLTKKKKGETLSFPPHTTTQPETKQKKLNAKVSKPRRRNT